MKEKVYMKMGYIYLRTNKVNGKKYIGKTINLKRRQYRWMTLSEKYAGNAINNARAKYGIDTFDFEILIECNDEKLDYWEKHYIDKLNTKVPNGYNLTDGGEGCYGYSLSEETKRKIGDANKGENNFNYGKHLSEKTRKKISESLKGTIFTEERKQKISESKKGEKNGMYGKRHTEEWKKQHGEKVKGKTSKPVLQIDKETNEVIAIFPSIKEVNKQLGYSNGHICQCCKGKRKTCGGFIWKYKESAA